MNDADDCSVRACAYIPDSKFTILSFRPIPSGISVRKRTVCTRPTVQRTWTTTNTTQSISPCHSLHMTPSSFAERRYTDHGHSSMSQYGEPCEFTAQVTRLPVCQFWEAVLYLPFCVESVDFLDGSQSLWSRIGTNRKKELLSSRQCFGEKLEYSPGDLIKTAEAYRSGGTPDRSAGPCTSGRRRAVRRRMPSLSGLPESIP